MPTSALHRSASPLASSSSTTARSSRTPRAHADRSLLERAGVAAEAVLAAYWAHREASTSGTASIGEYWQPVGHELGVEWNAIDVHELWAIDHRSWL